MCRCGRETFTFLFLSIYIVIQSVLNFVTDWRSYNADGLSNLYDTDS